MLILDEKAILEKSLALHEPMIFNEFIVFNNIDLDIIKVDKFFHNIRNDIPMLLDETLIKYFGYSDDMPENTPKQIREKLKKQKESVKELFETHLLEYQNQLWWVYNTDEYEKFLRSEYSDHKNIENLSPEMIHQLYPLVKKKGQKPNYILVMPKLFKEALMLCQTEKGKQIRRFYIDMLDVFNLYIKFQSQVTIKSLNTTIMEIKAILLETEKKSDERFQRLIGVAEETKTTLDETQTEVLKTNHKLGQAVIDRVVMGNIVNKEQQSLFIYKLVRPYDYEYLYYGIRCQNKSINPMLESRQKILNKARSKKNKLRLNTSLTFVAKIGHTGYIPNPILFWKEFVQNTINIFENYKYCKFDLCVAEIEFINILKSKDELRDQNIQEL